MNFSTPFLATMALLVSGCWTVVEGVGPPEGTSSTGSTSSGDGPGTPTTSFTPTTDILATTTGTDTTDAGDADSTSGTPDAPLCGDGVIEGDEACDDGMILNKTGNACSKYCKAAACGDGDLQVSNEEACDDGALNVAQPIYGQCSTICVRGGYCGDGVVQPEGGEECEPAVGPDDDTNCAAMCRTKPRFVFLVGTAHTGDLGGTAGADKLCNEAAAASPELTGTYRAWLLVDGQTLADRFPEFAEPVAWNFTNLGADLLATSFQVLVALGPASPVMYTELGAPLPEVRAWTNITATGVAAGGDCAQWTSTAGAPALVGHTGFLPDQGPMAQQWHDGRWWTDFVDWKKPCHQSHHLYCIQVGD